MNATVIRKTPFGPVAIVWDEAPRGPVVHQVLLSSPARSAETELHRRFPDAVVVSCADIRAIAAGIRAILKP